MKRSTILTTLMVVALALSSCGDNPDNGATGTPTAAGTSTANPTSEQPTTTPGAGPATSDTASQPGAEKPTTANPTATTAPAGGSGQECGVNPYAPAALAAIDTMPQGPWGPWAYQGESNYDPCAQLSYAVGETANGTGSSPRQFALFHDGEYIGTTTSCAYGFTSVVGATDNSVTVQYKWPRGNEANAEASGRATSTFTWVDGQVLMDPPLPAEIPGSSGC